MADERKKDMSVGQKKVQKLLISFIIFFTIDN